jgi:GTP cyclohydrolase IA
LSSRYVYILVRLPSRLSEVFVMKIITGSANALPAQGLEPRPEASTGSDAPIAALTRELLSHLGEDPGRPGLRDTPDRVARAYRDLTAGYRTTLDQVVNGAIFPSDYRDVVLVRDLDVFSLCEHHLLPFHGKAHVAYVPDGQVIGLSKIPRIVDLYARRLQLQENLTQQIADALDEVLSPRGVAVGLECTHLCMAMRGVEQVGSTTVTRALSGVFRTDARLRQEFFQVG